MSGNSNFYFEISEDSRKIAIPELKTISHELFSFSRSMTSRLPSVREMIIQINRNSTVEESYKDTTESFYEKEVLYMLKKQSIFVRPEFKLELDAPLVERVCKGKYFSFKVNLKSQIKINFPIGETIGLEVLIFSNDNMLVTKNMRGEELVKGNNVQNMHYFKLEERHVAYFRIQITEVTSHYIGKSLIIKIRANESGLLKKNGWKVQSLIIPGIEVKAKKKVQRKSNA